MRIFTPSKIKNQVAALGTLILMILLVPGSLKAQSIDWQTDITSAVEQAKNENKLVLLHFFATWSRPSNTLERFVFTHPQVQKSIAKNVISVKLDVDSHKSLAQEFAIASVPFDVVMTPGGRVVLRRKSPDNTSSYIRMIDGLEKVINALESGEHPAVVQNLAELKMSMDQTPSFSDQPGNFQPKFPNHQAPRPSSESATLARKSQRISNPYLKKKSKESASVVSKSNQAKTPNPSAREMQITNRFANSPTSASPHPANSRPASSLSNTAASPQAELGMPVKAPVATNDKSIRSAASEYDSIINRQQPPSSVSNFELENRMELTSGQTDGAEGGQLVASTEFTLPNPQTNVSKTQNELANRAANNAIPDQVGQKTALKGKCPVTLLTEGKWVNGDERFGCVHRNRVYLFASQQKLNQFFENPDAYSPILAGYDPVIFMETGKLVDGQEKYGVFMGKTPNQRVILFRSSDSRDKFQAQPSQYLNTIREAMLKLDGSGGGLIR